jgi:hypothetical protein
MGLNKLITYFSIGIAGVVCLIFVLDLAFNIFGLRLIAMDILFWLLHLFCGRASSPSWNCDDVGSDRRAIGSRPAGR